MWRLLAVLLLMLGLAAPAGAVEYRRQVSNLSVLWHCYPSRAVDLGEGIAVVAGENPHPSFAEWVYIVGQHPQEPTTLKAMGGLERRPGAERSNLEGPSSRS